MCPSVSNSKGLKSFCPWCLKLGGNAETSAIHLWEVHYRMTIMYNICWPFASMSAQSILDHFSGCKVKCDKEHVGVNSPQNPLKEVSGTKGNIPVTQARCCQAVIRSGILLYTFHLVKPVNVSWSTPWIVCDHPRVLFEQAFTQSDELSFLLFIYNGAHMKQSLTVLSYAFHVSFNLQFN